MAYGLKPPIWFFLSSDVEAPSHLFPPHWVLGVPQPGPEWNRLKQPDRREPQPDHWEAGRLENGHQCAHQGERDKLLGYFIFSHNVSNGRTRRWQHLHIFRAYLGSYKIILHLYLHRDVSMVNQTWMITTPCHCLLRISTWPWGRTTSERAFVCWLALRKTCTRSKPTWGLQIAGDPWIPTAPCRGRRCITSQCL